MIKLCVFDLDGTLLSTLPTINYFVSRTLVRYGLSGISDEVCCGFIGNGPAKLIARAFAHRGVTDEKIVQRALADYLADYDSDPFNLTVPFDGVRELLCALRADGIKIAVLSNKQDSSVKLASRYFFGELCDAAFGSTEGVPSKPEVGSVSCVLERFGVTASECAFVGDSDVDVFTGKNAGCALTVAVTWGYRSKEVLASAGAENFADKAKDILNIIEKYNKGRE